MKRLGAGVVLGALVWAGGVRGQEEEPSEVVARALEVERAQVALVERLSPSVAAVFPGEWPPEGGGSGVVIDPEGYVLTNFHVSGLATTLTVGLDDGRRYRARLLGIDPGGDIALLKLVDRPVGADAFRAVPLGNSDGLRVGERVLAMGNPFLLAEDFSPTVTQGVISGVHRYQDASGSSDLVYGDSIQMDASINPGNSGGPLFNRSGELIGINGLGGFRQDRGRVNVGVGYAASVDQIKNFLWDLRAGQQCIHGTMNATVQDVEVGEQAVGIPEAFRGSSMVVVNAVTRSSNAYRAGLRPGDVVVEFDGEPIETQNRLLTLVSRLPSGRRVQVVVRHRTVEGAVLEPETLEFRLEPLWSGPEQGTWVPDEGLVNAETQKILAAYRAGSPWVEWERGETVREAGGQTVRQLFRMRDGKLLVETGLGSSVLVDCYDGGRGWRRLPSGATAPLPGERRDLLAGTANALAALADPEAEAGMSVVRLAGGEWLAGRQVVALECRDAAGRRRLVYLDPVDWSLAGLAYPDGRRWVEESYQQVDGAWVVERVDYEFGAEISRTVQARWERVPQNPSLFETE